MASRPLAEKISTVSALAVWKFTKLARSPAKFWRFIRRGSRHPLFDEGWYISQFGGSIGRLNDPYATYLRNLRTHDPNPLFESSWFSERYREFLGEQAPLEYYAANVDSGSVQPTPLFDPKFYLEQFRNPANCSPDPLAHYIKKGWEDGLNPNPLFDTKWYLERNPDVARARSNPLAHYLRHGASEARSPHPLFDTSWYLSQYADVREGAINPLSHFLQFGAAERRDPHPLFSTEWYSRYPCYIGVETENLIVDYIGRGSATERDPHPLFQTEFYLAHAPIALSKASSPLIHYLYEGYETGRPNELFDNAWYLDRYPDVRKAAISPLVHYIMTGANEGRDPSLRFSTDWYLSEHTDVDPAKINPLAHFLRYGKAEGRRARGAYGKVSIRSVREARLASLSHKFQSFLESKRTLDFEYHSNVLVSIIIVTYNAGHHTFACLESLRSCLTGRSISYEIIVFDNGSGGLSKELLDRLSNVIVAKSDQNRGFVHGANAAADLATGEYLLFLNNDTQVPFGTVEAAISLLAEDSNIGAVGAKLILPDGSLQEAGSIIWSDGSCLGYCRGKSPDAFEANFRRDVDYCSGAFLLTPRRLFEQIGPLDLDYSPAYYEETDYCMRLWANGYRVVYDPTIVAFHFEFASSDSMRNAEVQQIANRRKFVDRHSAALPAQFAPDPNHILLARRRPTRAFRVLVVDDRVPHTHLGSGFPRARAMLNGLAALGAQVTLFPTDDQPQDWRLVRKTLHPTIEVAFGFTRGDLIDFIEARRGYYDAYLVSRPHNMQPIRLALEKDRQFLSGKALVYDAEAVFCQREITWQKLAGQPLSSAGAQRLVSEELDSLRWASKVLCVSERERNLISSNQSIDARILGHRILAAPSPTPPSQRQDIIFVGAINSDETPNGDSVIWFIDEVLPLLRQSLDRQFRFIIVGSCRSNGVNRRASKDVVVMGSLGDLSAIYDQARVFVAPTRFAAGVPHKVHEAAGAGVPVVASSLLSEQLAWTAGREILVGADAPSFAKHCADLYEDDQLWIRVRDAALAAVKRDCSPEKFDETLRNVLFDLSGIGEESPRRSMSRKNILEFQ
jgi:GT2 family glycosyltransferase